MPIVAHTKKNVNDILTAISLLHEPGSVFEVRIPEAGRSGTVSGYFDDPSKAAQAVAAWDGKANVYITLNPANPALLARAANRLKERAKSTTQDHDILRRRWLLVDCDPVKPAGVSASDEEKEAAWLKAQEVQQYLTGEGWPEPVVADSGNGYHLLYQIDLPNDDKSRLLVQDCLEALALRFDDEKVAIDTSVFNAARITKLYGTLAVKGDSTPDRPHRRSKILEVPASLQPVPDELLERLAAQKPKPQTEPGFVNRYGGRFDLQSFIQKAGLTVRRTKSWGSGTLYELENCPFNPDHRRTARIVEFPNGALSFGCFHASCSRYDWHALRAKFEPEWSRVTVQSRPANTAEHEEPWPEPEEITTTLLPVEPVDPELIASPLRPWLVDIAHRMQCPLDFVAAAAMVVAGALVGAGCGIRPKQKDDWLVIPSLWGGIVGRPGSMKSPALAEVLKPLSRLETEAKEAYERAYAYYEAEREVFRAQKEALKAAMIQAAKGKSESNLGNLKAEYQALEEPTPPIWRRYRTNDATIEKMAELLEENPRGILLFRDELVGLLTSWDREGREPDRAFYLEAWNGYGSMTVDRIGRGTVHCENMCVSILGGIQPAKLMAYLLQAQSDLQNDGLFQRIQVLVYPDESDTWQLVDEYPDVEARERAYRVFKKLAEMDFTEHGARQPQNGKIPYFHFDGQAQELFNEWLETLQAKLKQDEPPVLIEHLNKC